MRQRHGGIKLVSFDFEGTLVTYPPFKKSWSLINDFLGCEKEDRRFHDEYIRGEFDVATWTKKTVELYRQRGLTKRQFDELLLGKMRIVPGVLNLFEELRSRGIKTAIISGSLNNVFDLFSEKFGLEADYVNMAHRLSFDSGGRLVGGVFSNLDFDGKVTALRIGCNSFGIGLDECAHVGDEENDMALFREVGLPIAINTKNPELRAEARVVIEKDDIGEVINYI